MVKATVFNEAKKLSVASGVESMQHTMNNRRDSIIVSEELVKSFHLGRSKKSVEVLHKVSFYARAGEFVSIVGPSGSGKSTLLYCLSGLERADSGETWIANTAISRLSKQDMSVFRREHLGFVFQDYNLIDDLNALANVELPLRFKHHGHTKARRQALETMRRLGIEKLRNSMPSEMSGGECQRVAIARALVSHPSILFADEPTGALDSRNSLLVADLLQQVAAAGTSVIMVTHDIELASLTDRAVFLRDGELCGEVISPTVSQLLSVAEQFA